MNATEIPSQETEETYRLCYAEYPWAKFTTATDYGMLKTDDFDDRYRMSSVFETDRYAILDVVVSGPITDANYGVAPNEINESELAWFKTVNWADESLDIRAKITLNEFIEHIQRAGGEVYLPTSFCQK